MSEQSGGSLSAEAVRDIAARLDASLEELATRGDAQAAAVVAEIVDGLQRVHAEGLRRLVELLSEDRTRLERALDDPVVSNLLLLYDLVVVDETARAREALEAIRPLARSHGGEIELLGASEGVVRVRLHGACHGCPSSTATLRQGLERALAERLPGFVRLEVENQVENAEEPPAGARIEGGDGGYASIVSEKNLVRLRRRANRRPRTENGR